MTIEIILREIKLYFQMNKRFLNIKRIILYIIIIFIFCLFSPWWIISIFGILIGFYSSTRNLAIFESIISISMVWFIMLINNLFIQDYIIVNKMKDFFGFNSITLILITLLIPIFIGFISS